MMQSLHKKSWFDRYREDLPRSLQKGKYIFIVTFLFLPVVNFCIFYIGINFNSILMAFQKQIGYRFEWSFYNFRNLFNAMSADSQSLIVAIKNTAMFFVLDTIIMFPLTFYITYCFYKKLAGSKIFRVIIFLPSIMPGMVAVTVFKNMFGFEGIINNILDLMHIPRIPAVLDSDTYAIYGVLFYCFWAGMSANVLLFQGGMRRIPEEVLEAAQIDGCTNTRELFNVIIPMMYGTLSTLLVLNVSSVFTVSGPILLLTGGYHNTQTISFWIYDQTMSAQYNFPAAAGMFFTLVALPLVIVTRKLVNHFDPAVDY